MQAAADKATREVLGPTLAKLAREGLDVVCVDADLGYSTSAVKFGREFPDRFFPMGVAEQNMIGVAAGLASCGKIAFCSSFAVFAPGHCFDQLRMAVAQPRTNVKLFASHAGVVTGEDGASAEALEDLTLMLSMPTFNVLFPADAVECEQMIEAAARTDGPFYIRSMRPKTPILFDDAHRFELGKWPLMRDGKNVTLIACGELVKSALDAAETLAGQGVEARVLNASSLRPFEPRGATGGGPRHGCDRHRGRPLHPGRPRWARLAGTRRRAADAGRIHRHGRIRHERHVEAVAGALRPDAGSDSPGRRQCHLSEVPLAPAVTHTPKPTQPLP